MGQLLKRPCYQRTQIGWYKYRGDTWDGMVKKNKGTAVKPLTQTTSIAESVSRLAMDEIPPELKLPAAWPIKVPKVWKITSFKLPLGGLDHQD